MAYRRLETCPTRCLTRLKRRRSRVSRPSHEGARSVTPGKPGSQLAKEAADRLAATVRAQPDSDAARVLGAVRSCCGCRPAPASRPAGGQSARTNGSTPATPTPRLRPLRLRLPAATAPAAAAPAAGRRVRCDSAAASQPAVTAPVPSASAGPGRFPAAPAPLPLRPRRLSPQAPPVLRLALPPPVPVRGRPAEVSGPALRPPTATQQLRPGCSATQLLGTPGPADRLAGRPVVGHEDLVPGQRRDRHRPGGHGRRALVHPRRDGRLLLGEPDHLRRRGTQQTRFDLMDYIALPRVLSLAVVIGVDRRRPADGAVHARRVPLQRVLEPGRRRTADALGRLTSAEHRFGSGLGRARLGR